MEGRSVDAAQFDRLVQSLGAPSPRRRLLRLLAAVPVAGGLLALLAPEAVVGKNGKNGKGGKGGKGHKGHKGGKGGKGGKGKGDKGKGGNEKSRSRISKRSIGRPTPPSDPCAGQLDRTCCAGATGKKWCQRETCVAVPSDARATLAECQGRCDASDTTVSQEVCGQTLSCPDCRDCTAAPNNCDALVPGDGPTGFGDYCTTVAGRGHCEHSHTDCPNPATQMCDSDRCVNICYGTGG
jgi:hypothetical protein